MNGDLAYQEEAKEELLNGKIVMMLVSPYDDFSIPLEEIFYNLL